MTQGVRDAETASRMVRTQIQTLQQLSRTMGTTLNEALPALRQMRMSGLFTATEQIANVRQMRAADSFGVGQEAFLGMQAAGAQLTRDMQLGGAVGARLSAGTLMGIGTDVQAGRVSREGLLDMTGASTIEEAQTAAAVLGHNFPDSQWYKDAYALLQTGGLQPSENRGSWISRVFRTTSQS